MQPREIIAYYLVSSKGQGISGLGMEAQRAAVAAFATAASASIAAHYEEVERPADRISGTGRALVSAVAHARRSGAVLVIA